MPKPPAAEVDAGGRAVRVSSPERVIYEATDRTPEVTKLMVAEYFASVEDGLMRALTNRPTALERWPSGVREGMRLATGPQDKSAEAFYQKRVPKGAPDYLETVQVTFPSGRTADEICPTEIAVPVWCAHMGTLTFHPWPVRRTDVDRPDELRIDLDVRHAAIGFGRALAARDEQVTVAWWKEERGARIFVDFNQNCRDRTIASAYSLRPIPGAPVSTPVEWEELDGLDPRTLNLFTVPERVAARGDAMAAIDDHPGRLDTLLQLYADDIASGLTDMPYPPDYPKMPGEPPRVQPSRMNPLNWENKDQ